MPEDLTCFKAYDLRGRVPDEFNSNIAYRTGRAYAALFKPGSVVVGHDVRLSSPEITHALINGLTDGRADVINIGQCRYRRSLLCYRISGDGWGHHGNRQS